MLSLEPEWGSKITAVLLRGHTVAVGICPPSPVSCSCWGGSKHTVLVGNGHVHQGIGKEKKMEETSKLQGVAGMPQESLPNLTGLVWGAQRWGFRREPRLSCSERKHESRQMQTRVLMKDSDGYTPLSPLVIPVFTVLHHLHGASGHLKGLSAS